MPSLKDGMGLLVLQCVWNHGKPTEEHSLFQSCLEECRKAVNASLGCAKPFAPSPLGPLSGPGCPFGASARKTICLQSSKHFFSFVLLHKSAHKAFFPSDVLQAKLTTAQSCETSCARCVETRTSGEWIADRAELAQQALGNELHERLQCVFYG
ncbi:hypothetical protein EDB19DRAFT_1710861 [Suillus lakei]|nr:hypothetical protein EDB19DRAFT_1710861 [Suillus lakei]